VKALSIRKLQDLLKDPAIDGKVDIARRLVGYLDTVVREQSAFHSFEDLVKARGGYVPSIDVSDEPGHEDRLVLADAYDSHMELYSDPRRAYRYGSTVDNLAFAKYRDRLRKLHGLEARK
jgi:hypothetical protein